MLVHSPLVGRSTWSGVARSLRRRGMRVRVPSLERAAGGSPDGAAGDDAGVGAGVGAGVDAGEPYWRRHARNAARGVRSVPHAASLVLVAHSGAGPLLPAIAREADRRVAGYVFVDAGLPGNGQSRLAEMEAASPDFARRLRAHLTSGGRFPEWTDEQLRAIVPDDGERRRLLAEVRPRPLAFFEEPIPSFEGWPDAPCAYLLFSAPYRAAADQARRAGWPVREIDAGHFHMLVDSDGVAGALIELIELVEPARGSLIGS